LEFKLRFDSTERRNLKLELQLVPLVNVEPHLLIRLVKFARLPLRFHFSNDLLEDFHRFQTAFAFVAFDVQLHASVWRYRDFKFALGHKSSRLTGMNHCMSLPPKFAGKQNTNDNYRR
jgi:hypothetical protein